jgi:MYXO-CTERM domain-containing protein
MSVVAVAAMQQSAMAQNLLANPSFETGDLTGWTLMNMGAFSAVSIGGNPWPGSAHDATHYFSMGAQSLATQTDFYQDIPTVVGQQYLASFWAYDLDNPSSGFIHITFGGVDVGPVSGTVTSGTYTQYSLTYTATATTTRFEATGWEFNQWVVSDDYSVTATPAPGAAALLGLGGLMAARRRRTA